MQETGEVSHVEHLAAESDFFGGACAPPFCAVGRLSAPFNASSACWKRLSIRRREVFKGFGRCEPESYQAHRKHIKLIISLMCFLIVKYCEISTGFDEINCEISTGFP
jgi:hypothetical protein